MEPADLGAPNRPRHWANPRPSKIESYVAAAKAWNKTCELTDPLDEIEPLTLDEKYGESDRRQARETGKLTESITSEWARRAAAPIPRAEKSIRKIGIKPPRKIRSAKALRPALERSPPAAASWALHLCHAILTRSEADLRDRSLTEIARKKVPARISKEVVQVILSDCAIGQPGRKHQRSIRSMAKILLSPTATAHELEAWRIRTAPPIEPEPPPRVRPRPLLSAIQAQLDFFRAWKSKPLTAPYVPNSGHLIQQFFARRVPANA